MRNDSRVPGATVSPVQQRYIEVIADLIREKRQARTCDIAERISISLPSVSQLVGRLVDTGMARRKSRHEIVLTAAGRRLARSLDRQQYALKLFMSDILGFPLQAADRMACELEHFVDTKVVERLLILGGFMSATGRRTVRESWLRHLNRSLKTAHKHGK